MNSILSPVRSNPSTRPQPVAAGLLALLLPLAGCMTAPQHRAAVEDAATARLSVGTVQKEIRTGMSGADVVIALGAPNIVTTDEQRREVWVYDKVASEVIQSSTALQVIPLILGTGSVAGGAAGGFSQSAGATMHSSRTLTVVIKFDAEKKVRDFAYHATQF